MALEFAQKVLASGCIIRNRNRFMPYLRDRSSKGSIPSRVDHETPTTRPDRALSNQSRFQEYINSPTQIAVMGLGLPNDNLELHSEAMQSTATTVEAYLNEIPADRHQVVTRIRGLILQSFAADVCEQLQSGMLSYPIHRDLYPNGYHCDPKQDLPFIGLASQKHYVSLYHMGLMANTPLLEWFVQAYQSTGGKLDVGKCCVRFKHMDRVPFEVLETLFSRMDAAAFVEIYRRFDPRNRQARKAE